MLRVFMSYKFQDTMRNAWVDKLYRDLRDIGIDAKLYNYEVAIGESFSDYMARGVRDCDYFLFIITPEAVNAVESGKGAVAFEMQIANARRMKDGLKIIPIFREGNETSAYLLDHRYLDFRNDDDYDLQFAQLFQWLSGKIQPPALGDHTFESERDAINHARELTRSARNDFNEKNYAVAHKKLEIAIHLDTGDNATWALLGRTLTNLGRFEEAITPLTRAIERTAFKGNRQLYLKARSLANYFRGKYDLALSDAERIIELSPKEKEGHRLSATASIALGDLEKALEAIKDSIRNEAYLGGHAIKALILYKMGKKDEALGEIEICTGLEPRDSIDFYCLALAYVHAGNNNIAFEMIEKAIHRDSKCFPRVMVDPLFADLRDDARFEELVTESSPSGNKLGNE